MRQGEWRMAGGRLARILLAAAVWVPGAAAWAQDVEVTASLEMTGGIIRPGAYVPVLFKATNRTDRTVAGIRVASGGPVDVQAPWRLAPGESAETVVPVFCVASDLAFVVEFQDPDGRCVTLARVTPADVRPLPEDTALVAIQEDLRDGDEGLGEELLAAIGAKQQHVLRLGREAMILVSRCFMLDAMVSDNGVPAFAGLTIRVAPGETGKAVDLPPVSSNVAWTVQPETCQLFRPQAWPAEDRLRLWLWLGLFGLGVLVAAILVPRGHRVAAALVLVVLAAVATAGFYWFGDVRLARIREARVFYMLAGDDYAALEHLTLLESRGGAAVRLAVPVPTNHRADATPAASPSTGQVSPLPLPVLASGDDLFRAQGALLYADVAGFSSSQPEVLVHSLMTEYRPFGHMAERIDLGELRRVAKRPDLIEALLVEGDRATGLDGQTRPLGAWAAQWKGDPSREVAYAGRSLAWWDRERRTGDGPFILAWWRDRPAEAVPGSPAPERLPALVVYGRRAPPE